MAVSTERIARIQSRIQDVRDILQLIETRALQGEFIHLTDVEEARDVIGSLRHNVEMYNKERSRP
jgi:hypothetical protein